MAQKMRYIFTIYSIKRVVLCAAVNPRVNFKLATCDGWAKVCDGWARNCDGWANARPCPPLATPLSSRYTSHLTRVCTGHLGLTLSNSGWPYAYFLHSNL